MAATTDDLGVILESAGLAPSVHNTQPWRFVVDGDTIDVRADPERQLGYLDPAGRQLHVSCGAAIEFGYLAARACGRACEVSLLPDPGDRELLARLTLAEEQPGRYVRIGQSISDQRDHLRLPLAQLAVLSGAGQANSERAGESPRSVHPGCRGRNHERRDPLRASFNSRRTAHHHRTSTPRPFGISFSDGVGSSARWTESFWPG